MRNIYNGYIGPSLVKSAGFILFILFLYQSNLQAQTPSDAIMMKQKQSCVAIIADFGTWNQYWEGTELRSNATIATFKRYAIMPMISIGLHDRLNLIVMAPYVKTKSTQPNGGKFEGAKGFQDLSFSLKGEFFKKKLGEDLLEILATIGYSTPMSDYLSDYRPYSIGSGANEWSFRGIGQYKMQNGIYIRGTVSYLLRGTTEAERDYYYNNGSYYTATMDVPSAWNYHAGAGIRLFENSLRIEVLYEGLRSTSGDDIRAYNAPQPTNKVNFDQMGANAQYYFKSIKGLGLLVNYGQLVNGRNIGKTTSLSGGITYIFSI